MPEPTPEPPTRSPVTSGLKSHVTLVLGSDNKPMGYPLTLLNAKETAGVMVMDRAEPVTWSDKYILRGDKAPFKLPSVIRLRRNLHNELAGKAVAFTRFNLSIRDEATCQYTGKILMWDHDDVKHRATFDHVIPREAKGESVWENAVMASFYANNLKGNMELAEFLKKYASAGISLKRKPWVPSPADMLGLAVTSWRASAFMPEAWLEFLENIQPTLRVERIREGKLYAYA